MERSNTNLGMLAIHVDGNLCVAARNVLNYVDLAKLDALEDGCGRHKVKSDVDVTVN